MFNVLIDMPIDVDQLQRLQNMQGLNIDTGPFWETPKPLPAELLNSGLAEKGVRASNAQGVFDVPIAEWNIAMMFQLVRDMRSMFRNQEQKVWDRSARFQTEIRGST